MVVSKVKKVEYRGALSGLDGAFPASGMRKVVASLVVRERL